MKAIKPELMQELMELSNEQEVYEMLRDKGCIDEFEQRVWEFTQVEGKSHREFIETYGIRYTAYHVARHQIQYALSAIADWFWKCCK